METTSFSEQTKAPAKSAPLPVHLLDRKIDPIVQPESERKESAQPPEEEAPTRLRDVRHWGINE